MNGHDRAWRENIEAVIMALALALIFREYVFAPFKIPTGSMAPTFYGEHTDAVCANCGKRLGVGNNIAHAKGPIVACGNCGAQINPAVLNKSVCDHFPDWPRRLFWRGEYRILVNRFSYAFCPPNRWDIAVFRYPDPQVRKDDYVKRVIGLPNETVLIRRGDIYINGKIARKPPEIQDQVWIETYNSTLIEKNPSGLRWRRGDGKLDALAAQPYKPADTTANLLRLNSSASNPDEAVFARPITTYLPYNGIGATAIPVGDIRIEAEVTPQTAGRFCLIIRGDNNVYRARLDLGQTGRAELLLNGKPVGFAVEGLAALVPGKPRRIAFQHVDDALALFLDGRKITEYAPEPQEIKDIAAKDPRDSAAALATENGAACEIRDIRILRDLYYYDSYELGHTQAIFATTNGGAKLDENEFLMFGDNSSSSSDSRYWGPVHRADFIGKAFLIWWPPGVFRSLE